MPLTPGTHIGPYEVLSKLGEGGMGEVYRAHDTRLNRDVAIKALPAAVAGDADRLGRFRREAQVLASLNDPRIAQVYGLEESSGVHALVMELVEGPTLAERMARAPMSAADALPIARQIAEGLDAAHERGIVHRDLKPANVKVRDDGAVKILDFGLAKAYDPATNAGGTLADSPTMTSPATAIGIILGTAAYMAPEQARGRAVDKRADIWAFGVVLFEMLSGRRLFDGEDVSEVLAALLRQDIDWTTLPADTPPRIRALIRRCLERDPKRRLRDIGDALPDLDAAFGHESTAVTAPRSAPVPIAPWAVAAVAAIAATIASWSALHKTNVPPALVTRSETTVDTDALFLQLSHDGRTLLYTVQPSDPRSAHIVIRRTNEFAGTDVPGTEGGWMPILSPDGAWIAYTTLAQTETNELRKIPIAGGTSVPITSGDFFLGGAWGDDGTIVFGKSGAGLMRVSAAGGASEALTTIDKSKGEISHVRPEFLPGGRLLLFTVYTNTGPELAILDLGTRQYTRIGQGGSDARYATAGYITYVRDDTLFAVPFDVDKRVLSGTEVPVVEHVRTVDELGDYALSDNGLLAYVSDRGQGVGTALAWTDRFGKTELLPGPSRQRWGTGRLSPDGRFVANEIAGSSDKSDIWTLDVTRGTLTRLTFGGVNEYPAWSADGRRIAYMSAPDSPGGHYGLNVVAADGSGKPQRVFDSDKAVRPTSFTPDGSALLFDRAIGGEERIFVLPIGSSPGTPRPLHDASASEANAEVSPDGRWVAYESVESGAHDVYVQPFPGPGPKTRVSIDGGTAARWSHDGRELDFFGGASGAMTTVAIPPGPTAQPGAPQTLFRLAHGTTWDVTPDGKRFLVEVTGTTGGTTIEFVTNWFDELRARMSASK